MQTSDEDVRLYVGPSYRQIGMYFSTELYASRRYDLGTAQRFLDVPRSLRFRWVSAAEKKQWLMSYVLELRGK